MSFVDMGGYIIGAVLGIIGGAFAISYRPKTKMYAQQLTPA
jgi:nitrate/nitrite transporter NarK